MTLLLAVSVFRSIGILIALVVLAGFVVYGLINVRAGRREVGSEIELAANRKPYYEDEVLEGTKLDRSLGIGLLTLTIVGVGLPLYWLQEPSRQENAIGNFDRIFRERGEESYEEACSSCHGPEGVGGAASFTILDPDDNSFVGQVNWKAPQINTVLQCYSAEEVTEILNYGRPFSPMPAWGTIGGGPMTTQQIEYLVEYLAFIQPPADEVQADALEKLEETLGRPADFVTQRGLEEAGEVLFNLGRDDGFAGGAYACGRCHTQGWSISSELGTPNFVTQGSGETAVDQVGGERQRADIVELVSAQPGSGAYGPNITDGATVRQFPTVQGHIDFIVNGSENGAGYGRNGLGSGGMPGFGDNPNTDEADDGMLSPDMIRAIVAYERSL